MSAHDDYDDGFRSLETHMQMCDEIDRLRAEIDALKIMYRADQMVRSAVDSLMRELTAHADALRSDLSDALDALAEGGREWPRDTITAYDEFVKEC